MLKKWMALGLKTLISYNPRKYNKTKKSGFLKKLNKIFKNIKNSKKP